MWTFAWPWMLVILPLPLLVRHFLPERKKVNESGLKVPSLSLFSQLIDRPHIENYSNWRLWLGLVIWLLIVIASARPQFIGEEVEIPISGRNLMLAVDLSGSMDAKDFELAGVRVDRLSATKAVASDFISRRNDLRSRTPTRTSPSRLLRRRLAGPREGARRRRRGPKRRGRSGIKAIPRYGK